MLVKYLDERVEEANNDEEVDRIMTLEEEMIIRYDRGLRKGKEEGAAEEKRKIAKNLKKLGVGITEIEKATGLTNKEIEAL